MATECARELTDPTDGLRAAWAGSLAAFPGTRIYAEGETFEEMADAIWQDPREGIADLLSGDQCPLWSTGAEEATPKEFAFVEYIEGALQRLLRGPLPVGVGAPM